MPGREGWSGGYPVGQSYSHTLNPQMSPAHLALVLLLRNRMPPGTGGGFRYAELGCGTGMTLATLAAAHPHGTFHGVDFMPEHVAHARRLEREAGLANMTADLASFAELAAAPPPREPFDFIALHGVYTWVPAETRAAIVALIGRWLAPGGVAYVGYNAMPGWAMVSPLRRIVAEVLGSPPRASRLEAAKAAVEAYLKLMPSEGMRGFWDRIGGLSERYLLHEFGSRHGGAMWSSELAVDLSEAGLCYCGSADLAENFDALRLGPEATAFVAAGEAGGYAETARDLVHNRFFRRDVFTRGAPVLSETEARHRLGALHVARAEEPAAGAGAEALRPLAPAHEAALEAALGDAPQPIAELAAAFDLPDRQALQAVAVALAQGRALLAAPDPLPLELRDAAARFNAMVLRRCADDAPLPGLVSPRLRTGLPLAAGDLRILAGPRDAPERAALAGRLARHGIDPDADPPA